VYIHHICIYTRIHIHTYTLSHSHTCTHTLIHYSGSQDLPFYVEKLKDEITTPSLVVCLDR
jgi:hypothetical protein